MVFDNMTEEADDELRAYTKQVSQDAPNLGEDEQLKTLYYTTLSAESAEVRLIELSEVRVRGNLKVSFDESWPERTDTPKYAKKGWSVTRRFDDGTIWREMSRELEEVKIQADLTGRERKQKVVYRVRMAIELEEIRAEVGEMLKRYLRALPVALIFIGLGAWWVAGRAVKPVRRIIATAEHITPAGLEERITGVESADELGRLARVLNRMMDRIEGAFHQQRRFSADASHELRTPLAVMQGKIEAALQDHDRRPEDNELLAELLGRVAQLRSIIDSLLLLSRSDAGSLRPDFVPLDLVALLADVSEDAEIMAEERGIEMQSDFGDQGAEVRGDSRLLRLAVSNLLINGIKYNIDEGGMVRCELRSTGEDDYEIAVINTGPAISDEHREKIFERFYRADKSRGVKKPGFGLGLSLSQVIANAHGGELSLESSRQGQNCFVLRVPRELPPDTPETVV